MCVFVCAPLVWVQERAVGVVEDCSNMAWADVNEYETGLAWKGFETMAVWCEVWNCRKTFHWEQQQHILLLLFSPHSFNFFLFCFSGRSSYTFLSFLFPIQLGLVRCLLFSASHPTDVILFRFERLQKDANTEKEASLHFIEDKGLGWKWNERK